MTTATITAAAVPIRRAERPRPLTWFEAMNRYATPGARITGDELLSLPGRRLHETVDAGLAYLPFEVESLVMNACLLASDVDDSQDVAWWAVVAINIRDSMRASHASGAAVPDCVRMFLGHVGMMADFSSSLERVKGGRL